MSVDFKSRTYKCAFFDKIRSHYDVPIASCSTITKDYAKTIGRPKKFIKQINESLRDLKIHLDYLKFYFPKTFTVAEKVEPCSVRTKLMIGDPEELPKLKHTYDQSEPFLRRYRTEIQLYHSKLEVAVEPVREYLKRKNIETE
ncbi:hypothetical protein HDE_08287 [Halotydeus destructor]|nr:hypothetical protein HDE_08287 [Halotydeus destructor]